MIPNKFPEKKTHTQKKSLQKKRLNDEVNDASKFSTPFIHIPWVGGLEKNPWKISAFEILPKKWHSHDGAENGRGGKAWKNQNSSSDDSR